VSSAGRGTLLDLGKDADPAWATRRPGGAGTVGKGFFGDTLMTLAAASGSGLR